mgnify:CR=1 FL=1
MVLNELVCKQICILCLKISCCRSDSKSSAISFSKRIFSVPQQWKWTHFQLRGTGGAALHTIVLSHGEGESRYQNETNTNIHTHSWIAVPLASMVSFGWIFSNNPYNSLHQQSLFFTKIYQDRKYRRIGDRIKIWYKWFIFGLHWRIYSQTWQ